MTDFSRMMAMEGVVPLGEKSRPNIISKSVTAPVTAAASTTAPEEARCEAWAEKSKARTVLETALARLREEAREQRFGWIHAVKQSGVHVTLSTKATAAEILVAADHNNWRLVLIGGDGWTCILHPLMGAATLEQDPK